MKFMNFMRKKATLPVVIINDCTRDGSLRYTEVIIGTQREVFSPEKFIEQKIYLAVMLDDLGECYIENYTTDLDKGFDKMLMGRERINA